MPKMFRVTYDIVSPESAEHGDSMERGFVDQYGNQYDIESQETQDLRDAGHFEMRLKDALNQCYPLCDAGYWFDSEPVSNYRTGEETTFSLHMPENITASSYGRLRKVLKINA